jgi:predicted metal-dependent HD superfamily phosphohydrolase
VKCYNIIHQWLVFSEHFQKQNKKRADVTSSNLTEEVPIKRIPTLKALILAQCGHQKYITSRVSKMSNKHGLNIKTEVPTN